MPGQGFAAEMTRGPCGIDALPAEGFVLAGGASSRMGRDKALLCFGGTPFLIRALDRLRTLPLAAPPRITGGQPGLAGYAPLIPDAHSGQGPLSGIQAGLIASSQPWNLFLAVDLPLMPSRFLEWMLDRVALTGAAVTLPRLLGRPQPLCAVYHRETLRWITESLSTGARSVIGTLDNLSAAGCSTDVFDMELVVTTYPEFQNFSSVPWRDWFRNVNSPEDFRQLTRFL